MTSPIIPVLNNNYDNEEFITLYKKYKSHIKSKKIKKQIKLFKEIYLNNKEKDENISNISFYCTLLLKLKYDLIMETDLYKIIGIIALIIHILSVYFAVIINMYNLIEFVIFEQHQSTYIDNFKLLLVSKIDEVIEQNKCTIKYSMLLKDLNV